MASQHITKSPQEMKAQPCNWRGEFGTISVQLSRQETRELAPGFRSSDQNARGVTATVGFSSQQFNVQTTYPLSGSLSICSALGGLQPLMVHFTSPRLCGRHVPSICRHSTSDQFLWRSRLTLTRTAAGDRIGPRHF